MSEFKKKICTALVAISILTVAFTTLYFIGLFSEPLMTGYEGGNAFHLFLSGIMAVFVFGMCGFLIFGGGGILLFICYSCLVAFWYFCGSLCDKANKLINKP